MIYRVEVSPLEPGHDPRGEALVAEIGALGIPGVLSVAVTDLFFLEGELSPEAVERITQQLLVDPVIQRAQWMPLGQEQGVPGAVEVVMLPGVTDNVASSLLKVSGMMGFGELQRAASGQRYTVRGELDRGTLHRVAREVLANEVIHTFSVDAPVSPPLLGQEAEATGVEVVSITDADDAGLEAISQERRLALNLQ